MIIYCAENRINGKKYVGQTAKSLYQRIKKHEKCIKRNSKSPFYRALYKYGKESFDWYVLKRCSDKKDLNESEIYFINNLKTTVPNGYNISLGGTGGAIRYGPHTLKTKKKISKSVYKAMHDVIVIQRKKQGWDNYLLLHRDEVKQRVKKQWKNRKFRLKAKDRLRKRWSIKKNKKIQSLRSKRFWKNKQNRIIHSLKMKSLWKDRAYIKKAKLGMHKYWKSYEKQKNQTGA
jgi:group I intron endonuclease